ncbi:hydrogenase maturation factor, HypF [Mycobacterium bohemicum DSM 44277]|uniref:acylphosphatase n=1 Tax=Mycobacterium bohemicum DSM 44277 TaxID=1236609 RepID=A0A0U0WE12_MYCBE|nr:hydrogenase maturation factor, HypF [Mycobacterium bohemicum DSM 44277]
MTRSPLLLRSGPPDTEVRQRVTVTGVVQGVGFRPFVHRIAGELGLAGFVGNDSGAVFLEVQGARERVSEFVRRLRAQAPPLARIDGIRVVEVPADGTGDRGFRIVASRTISGPSTPIPPDVAVCGDCVGELFDPRDRRHRHPFITCTNCGPRFTIIRELPYDRPATTMAAFTMCRRCATEYHDPADRRFHAQPIACPECGPSLWFSSPTGRVCGSDRALAAAQRARQLIARSAAGDIAIAMSTSGNSPNLLAGLAEARRRGLFTVGFAGYDGGAFAQSPHVDACFVVRSQSVHRIQEAQALLGYRLWLAVHERLGDEDAGAA